MYALHTVRTFEQRKNKGYELDNQQPANLHFIENKIYFVSLFHIYQVGDVQVMFISTTTATKKNWLKQDEINYIYRQIELIARKLRWNGME